MSGRRRVAASADLVILTSDNPKQEDPRSIAEEIAMAIPTGAAEVIIEADRQRAIERASRLASAEDLILLAGKGHEEGQWINDQRVPFSDAGVLRQLGFKRRG